MSFKIQFETENAAFTENESREVARILWQIAESYSMGVDGGNILDINGNRVGAWDSNAD